MLGTATKLQNSRSINIAGAVKGNANFDGSSNITINTTQNNIETLTGSMSIAASSSENKTISYPSGINKDNCIVLAVGLASSTNTAKGYNFIGTYNDSSDGLNNAFYRRLNLTDEGIKLTVKNPNTSTMTVLYKISLLKLI